MCEVFLISKTNWGFFSMFTQKRRGRLDRERTNIFKIDRSSSTTALKWFLIATALMEWSTFLGCFFMLKKGSGNKGYGANTSVRHPASNNALNPQLLFSECEVGVQTAQTWKLWWFVSYWINTLKLLLSTKPNRHAKILLFWSHVTHSIFATTFSESTRIPWVYLLVFHMWTTSGSVIFLLSAWASKKSKKYLIATGALLLGKLQMLLKSFSTTEWIATWKQQS